MTFTLYPIYIQIWYVASFNTNASFDCYMLFCRYFHIIVCVCIWIYIRVRVCYICGIKKSDITYHFRKSHFHSFYGIIFFGSYEQFFYFSLGFSCNTNSGRWQFLFFFPNSLIFFLPKEKGNRVNKRKSFHFLLFFFFHLYRIFWGKEKILRYAIKPEFRGHKGIFRVSSRQWKVILHSINC